jgi:hypothetical protein
MTQTDYGQSEAVADQIVALLNAGTFTLNVSAVKRFARRVDLADISQAELGQAVTVDVFPGMDNADQGAVDPQRSTMNNLFTDTYGVHILIQQLVGADATGVAEARCSNLMLLRSQIAELVMGTRLSAANAVHPLANIRVIGVRSAPEGVYDLARLESHNVFESEMIVTYRAPGLRR